MNFDPTAQSRCYQLSVEYVCVLYRHTHNERLMKNSPNVVMCESQKTEIEREREEESVNLAERRKCIVKCNNNNNNKLKMCIAHMHNLKYSFSLFHTGERIVRQYSEYQTPSILSYSDHMTAI